MLARLVKLVLDSVPGPVVDRLRTLPVLAPLLRRALGVVSLPLLGHSVAIAHGPAKGLLLRFDETSAVWASGRTELDVQKTLERLVRPGSVFFDIGANIGFFTLLGARLVGPSGTVVAFEPHPENIERLHCNIDLNLFSNVVVVPKAASDASGDRLLDARHAATASIHSTGDARRGEDLIRVEATSLDDYLGVLPDLTPDIVKIDAEGHEVEIVRGMQETLERSRPVLVCEMHRRVREFTDAVELAGYQTATLEGLEVVESPSPLGHVLALPRTSRGRPRRRGA